uniref:non-specific serine/threonine protein kinase n=1 Tax=Trypanosoma congolense (strain IL3000) TaxID=1068625 RepID=G0UK32_TRYCI|nr:putative serine/threonine-protein kinase [Trypanosoma congolense IL3000]
MNFYNRIANAFTWVRGSSKAKGDGNQMVPGTKGSEVVNRDASKDEMSSGRKHPQFGDDRPVARNPLTVSTECQSAHERPCPPPAQRTGEATSEAPGAAAAKPRSPAGNSVTEEDDGFYSFLISCIEGGTEDLLQTMTKTDPSSQQKKDLKSESDFHNRSLEKSLTPEAKELSLTPLKTSVWGKVGSAESGSGISQHRAVNKNASSSAARSLKDYELLAYIGKGTFAEVTLARHRETHISYAIKKISKKKVRDEDCVQCTFTERQLLASFSHPFLVKLHQAFQSQTYLYLVLEFAQGGDLYVFLETKPWIRDMHRKLHKTMECSHRKAPGSDAGSRPTEAPPLSKPLTSLDCCQSLRLAPDNNRAPIHIIVFWAIEIALVLEYLHKHGFVYRDLKPENVLMMSDGSVVLADFGVAKYRGAAVANERGTSEGKSDFFAGTTPYMSPEVLRGEEQDFRIDWWSYGCMLFEMANGRRPFDADNRYDMVKSIAECNVRMRPDDFTVTELELEWRAAQLNTQYEDYKARRYCESAQHGHKEDECLHEELETTASADGRRAGRSAAQRDSPPPSLNFDGTINRSLCVDNASSFSEHGAPLEETWWLLSADRANASSANCSSPPFTVSLDEDDSGLFRKHAANELMEACALLQSLVLGLLQRSPEERLSGGNVLGHPFFSCPYVTSQLYFKNSSLAAGSDRKHLQSPTTSPEPDSVFPLPCSADDTASERPQVATGARPQSFCSMEGSGAESQHFSRSESRGIAGRSTVTPIGHCCVQQFLSNFPIQRPAFWRELFLNRQIKAPFVPQLRAADDLRYFPNAVTATGVRVADQQRALRRRQSRSSHRIFKENKDKDTEGYGSALLMTEPSALSTSHLFSCVDGEEDTRSEKAESRMSLGSPAKKLSLARIWDCSTTPEALSRGNSGRNNSSGKRYNFASRTNRYPHRSSIASPSPALVKSLCGVELDYESHDEGNVSLKSSLNTESNSTARCDVVGDGEEGVKGQKCGACSTSEGHPKLRDNPPHDSTITFLEGEETSSLTAPIARVCVMSAEETQKIAVAASNLPVETSMVNRFDASETVTSSHCSSRTMSPTRGMGSASSDEKMHHPVGALCDTLTGVAYDVDDYVPSCSKERGSVLRNRTGIPAHHFMDDCATEHSCEQIAHQRACFSRSEAGLIDRPLPAARQLPLAAGQTQSSLKMVSKGAPLTACGNVEVKPAAGLNSSCSSTISLNLPSQGIDMHQPFCAPSGSGAPGPEGPVGSSGSQVDSSVPMGTAAAMPHFLDFTYNGNNCGTQLLGGTGVFQRT